jgi:hypothetical protein
LSPASSPAASSADDANPGSWPATKGYSSKSIRNWLRQRNIEPAIPHKKNKKAYSDPNVIFDKESYRQRHVV